MCITGTADVTTSTRRVTEEVEAEWVHLKGREGTLVDQEVKRVASQFVTPDYESLLEDDSEFQSRRETDPEFARWVGRNIYPHAVSGYAAVTISLKKTGVPPGDVTAAQMDAIAQLADSYSSGELRVTHEQNLVLADVRKFDLYALWLALGEHELATPNVGLLTDVIACPGGDFCSLANAVSIPVARSIQSRFDNLDYLHDIGDLDLNISGCMNACGHHHVGHIGILGVDKSGEEWYQISIGGRQGEDAALGKVIGKSVARSDVPDVIENLIGTYLERRESDDECFVDVVHRLGIAPFKERVYAAH